METLIYALADTVRERALNAGIVRFECPNCDAHASIANPQAIAQLIEHARRGHNTVQSIMGVSYSVAVSPVEIVEQVGE